MILASIHVTPAYLHLCLPCYDRSAKRVHGQCELSSLVYSSWLLQTTDQLPPSEACDVIVAVVDFQVVRQARGVVFQVKIQEVQADALAVAHADVPVADLFVMVLLRIPRRLDPPLLVRQNSTTLLGCVMRSVELVLKLSITEQACCNGTYIDVSKAVFKAFSIDAALTVGAVGRRF